MDANIQPLLIPPNFTVTFFSKIFLAFILLHELNPLTFVLNNPLGGYLFNSKKVNMNANVNWALAQINISWKWFTHRGERMTKQQVIACLEYAKEKGYKHTGELSLNEVDEVINRLNTTP